MRIETEVTGGTSLRILHLNTSIYNLIYKGYPLVCKTATDASCRRVFLNPVSVYVSVTCRVRFGDGNAHLAMSCFWQTQMSSCSALTRCKNCLRATKRPGLPIMWG